MAVFNILTKISEDWTSTTMRRAGAVGTLQRGDRGTAGPSPPQPEPPRHLEELMLSWIMSWIVPYRRKPTTSHAGWP